MDSRASFSRTFWIHWVLPGGTKARVRPYDEETRRGSSMPALTEKEPLFSGRNDGIELTGWRWYIMSVFSLLATLQALPLLYLYLFGCVTSIK
jgi:hypothetical protein